MIAGLSPTCKPCTKQKPVQGQLLDCDWAQLYKVSYNSWPGQSTCIGLYCLVLLTFNPDSAALYIAMNFRAPCVCLRDLAGLWFCHCWRRIQNEYRTPLLGYLVERCLNVGFDRLTWSLMIQVGRDDRVAVVIEIHLPYFKSFGQYMAMSSTHRSCFFAFASKLCWGYHYFVCSLKVIISEQCTGSFGCKQGTVVAQLNKHTIIS